MIRKFDARTCHEHVYVKAAKGQPLGARIIWDGGKTGRHAGDGWVLVYGDGQHYGYIVDGQPLYSA